MDRLYTDMHSYPYSAPLTGHLQIKPYSEEYEVCLSSISPSPPTLTPASPAETRQGFCSTLLYTLLFPPPYQTFQIFPPGAERSPLPHCPVSMRAMHTHTTMSAWADRSRAVQKHSTHSVSVAPSCAITDSVFPHKRHAGPFKNRSTQHPPLHAGATWCHNQAPCWVCSLSSPLSSLSFSLAVLLTMDLSCPFLHFRFTSDPLFPPKPPWPETLNRSKQ